MIQYSFTCKYRISSLFDGRYIIETKFDVFYMYYLSIATIIMGRILANAKTNAKNMANAGYSLFSVVAFKKKYIAVKM